MEGMDVTEEAIPAQFPFFINPGVAFVPRSVADARPRQGDDEEVVKMEVKRDVEERRHFRDGARGEREVAPAAAARAREAASAARELGAKRQRTFDSRGKSLMPPPRPDAAERARAGLGPPPPAGLALFTTALFCSHKTPRCT
jgi:hypothetical protein